MSSERSRRTRKIVVRVIVLVLALLICVVLYDLYFPRTTHMREFDPDEVARLETHQFHERRTSRQRVPDIGDADAPQRPQPRQRRNGIGQPLLQFSPLLTPAAE